MPSISHGWESFKLITHEARLGFQVQSPLIYEVAHQIWLSRSMESSESPALITPDAPELLTLLQILSNPLILHHTIQYLPISSLLALGAASKPFQGLVYRTPNIFRYLDLSKVKSVQFEISKIDHGGEVWRNVQLDENVTEDE